VELPAVPSDGEIYEYACHEANYGLEGILRGHRAQEKEFQGSNVPRFQGSRVPGFQVPGFQGSRVPGSRFQVPGSRVLGSRFLDPALIALVTVLGLTLHYPL
jgi:hypothetical protein